MIAAFWSFNKTKEGNRVGVSDILPRIPCSYLSEASKPSSIPYNSSLFDCEVTCDILAVVLSPGLARQTPSKPCYNTKVLRRLTATFDFTLGEKALFATTIAAPFDASCQQVVPNAKIGSYHGLAVVNLSPI